MTESSIAGYIKHNKESVILKKGYLKIDSEEKESKRIKFIGTFRQCEKRKYVSN